MKRKRLGRMAPFISLMTALTLTACGSDGGSADEPAFETPVATLDAALACTPFANPDKPPVLLVHGTATAGYEQWEWTYIPLLVERGFDVCAITYPDRGLGDMQISAEYVVHALRRIRAESGRKVAMIGHSQGALMPRWALKWWPSARAAVQDFVLLAGPNPGPANIERAGGAALCGLLPILLDQIISPAAATVLASILRQSAAAGLPALRLASEEPPLKPYARVGN